MRIALFENPPRIEVTFITTFHSFGRMIVVPPKTQSTSRTLSPSASSQLIRFISEPPNIAVIFPPWKFLEEIIFVPPPKMETSSILSLFTLDESDEISGFESCFLFLRIIKAPRMPAWPMTKLEY